MAVSFALPGDFCYSTAHTGQGFAPGYVFGGPARSMRAPWLLIILAIVPAFPSSQAAVRSTAPMRRPAARRARLHRVVFHSPLRGTRESLLRQNERIDSDNLERIQDDSELEQLKQANELVALPDDDTVQVSAKLPEDRRYCRPWTRDFLADLGQKSFELFQRGIVVTSAVRTIEVQHKLIRHNGNAAPETGELASPHLSGAAVDIAKKGLTRKQLAWMRTFLLQVQNSGMADVEEEFRQSVFHITVYREYAVARAEQARREPAQRETAPLARNEK